MTYTPTPQNNKLRKRDKLMIILFSIILLALIICTIVFWKEVSLIFEMMINGVGIVKEFILGLGWKATAAMVLLLIFCFFFPVISGLPVEIAAVVSYGVVNATVLISLTLAFASQIVFLIYRNVQIFSSPKRNAKRKEMQEKIANSKWGIYWVLLLAYIVPGIPFLMISSVAAMSDIKWWKYTLFTLFGPVGEIVVTLLIGNEVVTSSPVGSAIMLGVIILLIALSLIFKDKVFNFVFKPKEKNLNKDIENITESASDENLCTDNNTDSETTKCDIEFISDSTNDSDDCSNKKND
ncbi:MAG: VTT domain-containing protein [Clostridia bacterium]